MKSDDESYEDSTADAIVSQTGKVPEIIVSTEPTELIATDGPMQLAPIQGTGLLYASNTPSRLFLEITTQKRFILISGRWYTALSMSGQWLNIASEKLPVDFKNIPPGSECDDVLASVAGTIPAKEAVYDAQIPQMAEVDRTITASQVEYDGNPQFEPIGNTGMDYAVNTSMAVIRVNGLYYNCDRGIWFDGASPFGPWRVCIDVPEVIYTIPSRFPIYNVRYVRVYRYTPDVVYVGYTAGYTGCYVYGRTVVYGTGYNYHPWFKHKYYARPWTWGFDVHYDPWTGWSFGAGWGQSHGWFAHYANDEHAGWWGTSEYHPVYHPATRPVYREGYHPVYLKASSNIPIKRSRNEASRTTGVIRSATLYDNRSSGVRRPVAVETPRSPGEVRGATPTMPRQPDNRPIARPVSQPISKPQPRIVTRPSTREDNVYAAPNGNIMRSTPQGWQQRDQNTWKKANETPAKQAIVRDSAVRQRAAERTSNPKTASPAPKRAAEDNNKNR